jgi:trehalose-6-phosphate synthase
MGTHKVEGMSPMSKTADAVAEPEIEMAGRHRFVVVASRLPVDRTEGPDGQVDWQPSPGGLVSALEPVMRETGGVWIGWSGDAGPAPGPMVCLGLDLVGMGLSADQVRDYYEGFCNATLWPLYHDVIAPPEFHRRWWDAYVTVNRSFAQAAVDQAAPGATIWVHDYQLQLVPQMVREQRGDVRIGFFNHIRTASCCAKAGSVRGWSWSRWRARAGSGSGPTVSCGTRSSWP